MVKTILIVFSWFNKRIVFRRKALNQKSSQSIFNPSKNIYHSISLFPFSLPQIKIRKKTSTTCLKRIKKLHSNVKKKKKKRSNEKKITEWCRRFAHTGNKMVSIGPWEQWRRLATIQKFASKYRFQEPVQWKGFLTLFQPRVAGSGPPPAVCID